MNELERLRADIDIERAMNRKLWVAIAYLQQSVGVAIGYCNVGDIPSDADNFYSPSAEADKILSGLIALSPAK